MSGGNCGRRGPRAFTRNSDGVLFALLVIALVLPVVIVVFEVREPSMLVTATGDSATVHFAHHVCFDNGFPFRNHAQHAVSRENEDSAFARKVGNDVLVELSMRLEGSAEGELCRAQTRDDDHAEDQHHRRVGDECSSVVLVCVLKRNALFWRPLCTDMIFKN